MRGRLIQKFFVDVARLDAVATQAAGFDPEFNEPSPVDDGSQLGGDSRRYHPLDILHCQLDRTVWGGRESTRGGEEIKADIVIVLHWPELERMALLSSSGQPVFQRGDKIVRIRTLKGAVEEEFDDPPGMFITSMDRAGHGLAAFRTPRTNLLYLYCSYDKQGENV